MQSRAGFSRNGRFLLVHWPITRYHNRHSLTSADGETLLLPMIGFQDRAKKDESKRTRKGEPKTSSVARSNLVPLMANRLSLSLGATQKRQQQ